MPLSEHLFCWVLDGRNQKSVALNLEDDAARGFFAPLISS
jgi:hypothetical protein